MKSLPHTLALIGAALFLVLNLVNFFFGLEDAIFAAVMACAFALFLPMIIVEIRKKR